MVLNNDEDLKKVEFLNRNTETFQNVTMLNYREVWDATRFELHWKALKCKSVKICEDRLRIQREIRKFHAERFILHLSSLKG